MMKQIQFSNTSQQVSEMALGCLGFGTKNDREISYKLLDYFVEQGGNFLDTSNNYSFWNNNGTGGESEALLGRWMKERKNRERIFLATKAGAFPTDREKLLANTGTAEGWRTYTEGLSRKAIVNAVEKSLQRLQTGTIDLYYAHIDHRADDLEETLEAFNHLITSGKVKHIGCSNYKTWRIEQARQISKQHEWAPYQAVQQFHTYLQPKPGSFTHSIGEYADDGLLDYCRENKDITLLAYTPLLWGMYTVKEKREEIPQWNNYNTPENMTRLEILEKITGQSGATINQIIYAWMIQGNPRVIPLVAVSKLEHLKENLDSVSITLSQAQLDELNSAP
jgi:aryl-alcohol dehydrogenase-like predicted oxidoreductase